MLCRRRILTDYGGAASSSQDQTADNVGFEGHPLRKDFPMTVRLDTETVLYLRLTRSIIVGVFRGPI